MCIAIVKTKDGKLTDTQLRNCFDSNPDGAGIAYSTNGKLYIVKGIFKEDDFIKAYHEAEKIADGAMLIHCRISTSGHVDKNNCHPHIVHDNCVMIHNGILDIDVPKNSDVSDTVIFVRDLLQPLPTDFMLDDGIMNMITHIIGKTNKFCFLNENGEYSIANEEAGHWKDGVWFSNYSYLNYGYSSYFKKGKGYKSYKTSTYCYGGYNWEDEDDYWTGDLEDNDYYSFTKDEENKVVSVIYQLTPDQLVKLGENPIYDFWSGSLKRGEKGVKLTSTERYLEDIDEYIYEEYMDLYYEATDDIFSDEVIDTEEDDLSDWKQYILSRYAEAPTDEDGVIEADFEETYKDYELKVNDFIDDEEDIDEDEVVDVDYSTEDIYDKEYMCEDEDEDLTEEEYEALYNRAEENTKKLSIVPNKLTI